MNEFLQVIRGRRSVRSFEPRAVPRALMLSLLEAASWAPSAGNRQDWQFVVVTDPAVLSRMAEAVRSAWQELIERGADSGVSEELQSYAGNFAWFGSAPCLVVITCKRSEAFLERLTGPGAAEIAGGRTSAAMAAQNLMLAAHASGLGSCCLTGPLAAATQLKDILGIGRRRELVCVVAIGFAAQVPPAPPRRDAREIAIFIDRPLDP